MADSKQPNAGFTLPPPSTSGTPDAAAEPARRTDVPVIADALPASAENTSSRDLLVGAGILLVLWVAFFFAKNAYANTLVGRRVPPNRANAAGWWLFVFLASLATGVVLLVVSSSRFMTPFIMGPLALVGLVALALMVTSSRN